MLKLICIPFPFLGFNFLFFELCGRLLAQENLQRACGVFLAGLKVLQDSVPEDFFLKERPSLIKSFMAKHSDIELLGLLESSSPPVKLDALVSMPCGIPFDMNE